MSSHSLSATKSLLLLILLLGGVYSEPHSRQNENHFNCGSDEYLSGDLCCKLCRPGEFVQKPCTVPQTQGKCERCHPGMFTEASNGLDSCRACSSCDKNQEMVADCSATSDRKCQCRIGHFYADPQAPELCLPCNKCPQGVPVLQECSSTANTVCSSAGTNQRNRLFLLTVLPALAVLAVFCYYLRR
ncbi:tumor necrosis factor receptor superfamily member 23-like isoform X1 [Chionomys nivalis]|uniref:tumor necrosis factor receptor superfamily member 23-like isoform X1 n=1 Tax=Chionomys nivalis TaxID=269649 RepID=UPI0025961D61|nr:tumor necrosis factor receptor superfamily member 23-like isoform X1 [Chionomys nivalis]